MSNDDRVKFIKNFAMV